MHSDRKILIHSRLLRAIRNIKSRGDIDITAALCTSFSFFSLHHTLLVHFCTSPALFALTE